MEVKDKRAIVTGAASGFGKSIALGLAEMGVKVAAFDINEDGLKKLKSEKDTIEIIHCNVADARAVDEAIVQLMDSWNGLEILVNNAGIMKNALLFNYLDREDKKHALDLWQQVIDVNQNGVFYMTRSCVEQMVSKRSKGVIVNISSIASQGNIGQTAYSASKAAVEAMTKVWAKELGRFGIRSVAIAPGFMDTAGTHEALEEKMLSNWIDRTPLKRTGTIDEVAKTVYFAIENDFVNGEVIHVDGGLTI